MAATSSKLGSMQGGAYLRSHPYRCTTRFGGERASGGIISVFQDQEAQGGSGKQCCDDKGKRSHQTVHCSCVGQRLEATHLSYNKAQAKRININDPETAWTVCGASLSLQATYKLPHPKQLRRSLQGKTHSGAPAMQLSAAHRGGDNVSWRWHMQQIPSLSHVTPPSDCGNAPITYVPAMEA